MKILVIRIGRAGDMVMITPALTALIEKYPQAEITLLTSPDGKRVLNGFHPQIKKVWLLDRKKLFPFIQRSQLKKLIQQSRFEHIFCFETKTSFEKLFQTTNAQQHTLQNIDSAETNFAERCLHLVNPSLTKTSNPVYLPVTAQAEQQSNELLQTIGITKETFVIGLHPSFSGLAKGIGRKGKMLIHKSWPEKNWGKLSEYFSEYAKQNNIDIKVIIDLLPDEEALGQRIVAASNNSVNLLIPKPNFERYKATLSRMNILVAPDTGPAHIAAAVGTNLLELFSGHNPKDCAPYAPDEKLTILCAENYPRSESGLKAISAEEVFQASKKFLPADDDLSA